MSEQWLMREPDEEGAGGHYTTAGAAVATMGVVGLVYLLIRVTTGGTTGFIGPKALGVIATGMVALGVVMGLYGAHLDKDP